MSLVSIDAIVTDRVIKDTVGLPSLAARMREGNYTPILVRTDMTLIDGLRRIAAAKSLGWEEIDAVVTDNVYEVKEYLHQIHGGVMPHPRRLYEFYPVIRVLIQDHYRTIRRSSRWRVEDRGEANPSFRSTEFYVYALNIPYGHFLTRVNRLYKGVEAGEELAIDLAKKVDAGEIALGTAASVMETRTKVPGSLTPAEQKFMLDQSIRSLSMVAKTLKKLGGKNKIQPEEFAPLLERLLIERSEVYGIISKLAREARRSNE